MTIETVLGPVDSSKLGVIAPHEHFFIDTTFEAHPSVIEYQLEKEQPMLLDGTLDGVIIHTNAVLGMDKPFAAVEACKAWMDKNGDTIIP